MKIKIVQFIHGLSIGGAETVVKNYCLRLDKEKFDVVLICLERYGTEYENLVAKNGVKIIFISDFIQIHMKKHRYSKWFQKIVRKVLSYYYVGKAFRMENPEILHSHLLVNLYVLASKIPAETKLFHTVHSDPFRYWGKKIPFTWKLDRWAAKQLAKKHHQKFIVLHEDMAQKVKKLINIDDCIILNNGIDFKDFKKITPKETIRKEEMIPKHAFVVGHIGRFADVKNHIFLVDIFAEICKQKNNAFLLMVGDGSTKTEIENKLKELGLKDKYKILANRTDVSRLMSAMDVFVFPSIIEGLGISLIEAQKMELPCIVSDTVPVSAKVSNLIKWISLRQSAQEWADATINFAPQTIQYFDIEQWDIQSTIQKLESNYLN